MLKGTNAVWDFTLAGEGRNILFVSVGASCVTAHLSLVDLKVCSMQRYHLVVAFGLLAACIACLACQMEHIPESCWADS